MYQNECTQEEMRAVTTKPLHAEIDRLKAYAAMHQDDARAHWNQLQALQAEHARLTALLFELASTLGVKLAFGAVEEEAILTAARRLVVKAGEDRRLELVLDLIRAAHTTILMGSAPKAKADLGAAARLLAALLDGRA